MKDTGRGARRAVADRKSTLRAEILKRCKRRTYTCYELESELKRTHQSVSGTITYLVRDGELEIKPYTRVNQFGNEVRVYKAL